MGGDQFIDLDPTFPNRLLRGSESDVVRFLQSLLERYSTCKLSIATDRPVALSGLLGRIGSTLRCEQSYGVIGEYLPRTLIWHWTSPRKEKIKFGENNNIPSWSWMGYEGGIQFYQIPYRGWHTFQKLQLTRDGKGLVTNVWEFQDCSLQKDLQADSTGSHYQILDMSGESRGWVMYDDQDYSNLPLKWAVVLGMEPETMDAYLLIVRRTVGGEYERLGIGKIQGGYVLRKDWDAKIV